MDYLWLKAAHVTAVLIFISGLFVQAIGVAAGKRGEGDFVALVSLWDQRVTLPAMLATWLTGAAVAASGGWFVYHWLQLKLIIVVALSGLHGVQSGRLRRLRGGLHLEQGSPFAVPVVIAFFVTVIAILAVTKPF